jgi:hypothetical protein
MGDYMAARYDEVYRILGAFYHGEHDRVAALADGGPALLRHLFALAAGRSNLALGRLDEAERDLTFARQSQLCWGTPGIYEAQNYLAFLLADLALGKLAIRRGRVTEGEQKIASFRKRLPQMPVE